MKSFAKLSLVALSLFAPACGPPSGGGDSSADGGTDGGDARTDATLPATESGVTTAMCAAAVDLNAMGMASGETVTLRGSTDQPTEIMPGPCNPSLTGHKVHRYVVRGDNVWLRATTVAPGGTPYLDTSVWVLEGACSESARVLECNDDDSSESVPPDSAGSSTLSTRSLRRGDELHIVVGAYANARRGAVSRGEYTLSVTEAPSAAAGAECDSTIPGGCVQGQECAASSPTRGRCVAPQTEAEPNNMPAAAGTPVSVGMGVAIRGSIMPAGDVDCYALAVTAGQTLFIEASDGGGSCPADLRADLYRAGEADPFEGDDDTGRAAQDACPRILPTDNPGVRMMPAGTYTLCVRVPVPDGQPATVVVPRYSVHVSAQ